MSGNERREKEGEGRPEGGSERREGGGARGRETLFLPLSLSGSRGFALSSLFLSLCLSLIMMEDGEVASDARTSLAGASARPPHTLSPRNVHCERHAIEDLAIAEGRAS